MPLKIVRNDITKMNTEAIVNTANAEVTVGSGCDRAIYKAAGYKKLLDYRKKWIGPAREGEAFLTPGFNLRAKYIIHAVSPVYRGGAHGEEARLRSCYRNSLRIAGENGIKSIAIPLIATGGFGYPTEDGMRIAVDEINAFLLEHEMDIYLVVFGEKATLFGKRIAPDLESYIERTYVERANREEYGVLCSRMEESGRIDNSMPSPAEIDDGVSLPYIRSMPEYEENEGSRKKPSVFGKIAGKFKNSRHLDEAFVDFETEHESKLEERIKHMSDTYSEYLLYLIQERSMENSEVYKRAIVDKKIFSKIKNNPDYHPNKRTALCLCVGAKLSLDESKDLLARAGYALSPCDKTDIIFSYFIENEIYDMIELDIQLEEHGLPCIIS